MTMIDLRERESIALLPEAILYADRLVVELEAVQFQSIDDVPADFPNPGLAALDIEDRNRLVGTGYLYMGHVDRIDSWLYRALLDGYTPTPEQLAAKVGEGGDFMGDEINNLHNEHPDVHQLLDSYGYGTKETVPLVPRFVGAFVLPRELVRDIFATMFMRGQDYRGYGWGFPWISSKSGEEGDNDGSN